MLGLYKKLLGHPFVYDQIRPRVVGGIDMRPLYDLLSAKSTEAGRVVLDVGCGTGDALKYLGDGLEHYLGIDTDPVAIEAARKRYGDRKNVRFECRMLKAADVLELSPTGVVLSGVLHHLTNQEAVALLQLAAGSPSLVRIVTSDIVFLPGKLFNNVLAMMDRGRYCRHPDSYASLARTAGLEVDEGRIIESSPGNDRVQYFLMGLAKADPADLNAAITKR
jgi:SAM-dependent methyltransferase